jgi:hypothetical protein
MKYQTTEEFLESQIIKYKESREDDFFYKLKPSPCKPKCQVFLESGDHLILTRYHNKCTLELVPKG